MQGLLPQTVTIFHFLCIWALPHMYHEIIFCAAEAFSGSLRCIIFLLFHTDLLDKALGS